MRTLIYTCADKKYSHWIPLYCLAMLYNNKDIDIEIGMEGILDDNERTCIKYLREQYPQSRIVITENLFTVYNNRARFNGSDMLINTVRFLSTPTIHDEYVYIGDIDILWKFSLLNERDKETILDMIDVMLSKKERSEVIPTSQEKV